MDTGLLTVVVVIVVVIAIAAVLAAMGARKRRSERLRERFGDEYDRTVGETGDARSADAELADREKRRKKLDIRPLDDADRDRYLSAWENAQNHFVDAPSAAIREADLLITQVMRDRGYPMDDFDQRAADVSVDHPDVVRDYRAAHAISVADDDGTASTEQLREAMVHYRALFDRLVGTRSEEYH